MNFIQALVLPISIQALTTGPNQPEVQNFTPASTNDMVDLFSGDFNYNLPLFELPGPNGGYPFNLAYSAGIGVDQEASWVGLGWTLNPGAINRQVRGIPDDFKGDLVTKKMKMKSDRTLGLSAGANFEGFGFPLVGGNLGIYYNNYRGIGYNVGADIMSTIGKSGLSVGVSASLDTQDGLSLSPSVSYTEALENSNFNLNAGFGFNSLKGASDLQLSLSQSSNGKSVNTKGMKNGKVYHNETGRNISLTSSSISFSNTGFTPSISMPTTTTGVHFDVKTGLSVVGIFANAKFSGYYTQTKYKEDPFSIGGYGTYYHHLKDDESNVLLDINRENDQMLTNETRNLPSPNLMYDIYSLSGQGFGGSFRAKLNYIPFLGDQKKTSDYTLGKAGLDLGVKKFGVSGTAVTSNSVSGSWVDKQNDFRNTSNITNRYSKYKMYGEALLFNSDEFSNTQLNFTDAIDYAYNDIGKFREEESIINELSKTVSNSSIIPIENKYLKDVNNVVPELLATVNDNIFKRSETHYRDHHIGAFITTNTSGLRYIYSLPVYNKVKEEYTLSVSGRDIEAINSTLVEVEDSEGQVKNTDKFQSKTSTDPYTYAHLLTAVIGPDYVDLTGDGISEDDLGYWVKFSYTKHTNDFRWRAPYTGMNYSPGSLSNLSDDKGSFSYGEKEIYYLDQVETATHIAKFITSEREDALSAFGRFSTDGTRQKQKKLDKIKLFSREEGVNGTPLKTIHFNYTKDDKAYSLCKGIPNHSLNTDANKNYGKLTLYSLHYTYGNTNKSYLNPYRFEYNEGGENDKYNTQGQDRWGTYRSVALINNLPSIFFPYTEQKDKENLDKNAGLWSLSKIIIPSGAILNVAYESDDYAYVQDKEAMVMARIKHTESGDINENSEFTFDVPSWVNSDEDVQKFFDFEANDVAQVAFNVRLNANTVRNKKNDFMGYALTNRNNIKYDNEIKKGRIKFNTINKYNPLSMAAWQYIQKSEPSLLGVTNVLDSDSDLGATVINSFFAVVDLADQLSQFLISYYSHCSVKGIGQKMDENFAFIRIKALKEDDYENEHLIKYGGGHRVAQISMYDGWNDEQIQYGQLYKYEINRNGRKESSGVAAYEPLIGGEEIPQRKAIYTTRKIPMRNNEYSHFELPINENLYPSASVGYSQVEVYDLVSAKAAGIELKTVKAVNDNFNPIKLFSSFGAVNLKRSKKGKSIHRFYTAKDFPVKTYQTEIKKQEHDFYENYFVYLSKEKSFTGSQGYSIELNDMHGKPKEIAFHNQNADGKIEKDPSSFTRYYYDDKLESNTLNNKVNVLINKGNGFTVETRDIGVEVDAFVDTRHFYSEQTTTGANFNVDLIIAFFPISIPSLIPNQLKNFEETSTMVSNKIIHRNGILRKVEMMEENRVSIQENLYWDENTGNVICTKNSTQYYNSKEKEPSKVDFIYNLKTPAYSVYPRMGKAAVNEDLIFEGNLSKFEQRKQIINEDEGALNVDPNENIFILSTSESITDKLIIGDEFILQSTIGNPKKVVFVGYSNNKAAFEVLNVGNQDLNNGFEGTFKMVRSGNRNILGANVQEMSLLGDPKSYSIQTNNNSKRYLSPRFN
ncbi:hypothetical protein MY04_5280 [Flammeovirga sp. MY04]|uniref:hypothetical protein n=1 Tax=Flammeovirga sp. MY04 TaxID=1191459 RepID=UPI0008064070|nr:hypothetical protein [Flammeovirga sp. MY04]ANQ52612.1 hypothetical protein MY04_5280 [Flammeovirga sp. MY04]